MTVLIQTCRLKLRPPTVEDLPAYLAYRNDPVTLQSMGMERIDEARALAFLRNQSELEPEASGWRMLGVERVEQSGLIGEVGVFLPKGDPTQGDLGWWLHPDYRRKGYAAEAARALVGWCLGERGLERISAACLADNTASRSVIERIGLRLERQSTASRRMGDQLYDELGYVLLRKETVSQARAKSHASSGA